MVETSGGVPAPAGRRVNLALQNRQVRFEAHDGKTMTLAYSGILITSYQDGDKVAEKWVPVGPEPTEADDEQVIQQLRQALLWQSGKPPADLT